MRINDIGQMLRGSTFDPGEAAAPFLFQPQRDFADAPLISCMMPTRGLIFPARLSIECFRRQHYPNRELVIVCQSKDSEVERYVATLGDPRIRFFHCPDAANVGEMRNFALSKSEGELISVWDDDDLSQPTRLNEQLSAMQAGEAKAAFFSRITLWWPATSRLAIAERRLWEGTMLADRSVVPSYTSLGKGEDTALVLDIIREGRVAAIDHPAAYVYVLHGKNICDVGHFRGFYSRATLNFDGDAYAEAIADLATQVPIDEYAVRFWQLVGATRAGKRAEARTHQLSDQTAG